MSNPGARSVRTCRRCSSPECFGVHAIVHETPEAVAVELRGGTLPEAVGRACIMIAVSGNLNVQ